MKCPFCLDEKIKVVDKRDIQDLNTIRRRRECLRCGKRFTTYERIESVKITVIKKDSRRESFDRGKLLAGILKACEKRPIPREKTEKMADEIEAELRNSEKMEIPSSFIGKLVMEKLKQIDKVAYIRFASVYRKFADLGSFERELKKLRQTTESGRGRQRR